MKYKLIFAGILFLIMEHPGFTQQPNQIKIALKKDSFFTINDCLLDIKISRKDGKPFLFPLKYGISNETSLMADIIYILEKADSAEGYIVRNGYRKYLCKYSNFPLYAIETKRISYQKIKSLNILDSLTGLDCIDSGRYRLKIMYNKKPNDGKVHPHNLTVSSNWVSFYVVPKELLLSRYRIKLQAEKKQD